MLCDCTLPFVFWACRDKGVYFLGLRGSSKIWLSRNFRIADNTSRDGPVCYERYSANPFQDSPDKTFSVTPNGSDTQHLDNHGWRGFKGMLSCPYASSGVGDPRANG